MTFEVAGDVCEDALNVFIQVRSLCFIQTIKFVSLLLLLLSPNTKRVPCKVNRYFPLFQDLLWEKMFKNKAGQPMTVIRLKVQ